MSASSGSTPRRRLVWRGGAAFLMLLTLVLAACGGGEDAESAATPRDAEPDAAATPTTTEPTKLRFQLAWLHQGEFAGFYMADKNGYYADEGLEIEWLVGGPDIQAARNIATGVADLGEATVPQILSSRGLGVPVVSIFQHQQTTVNYYLAREGSGIESFEDVVGRKVGLWFGGLEIEFLGILAKLGIDADQVDIFSQGFTITPWLEEEYDVMQVVPWNEYQQAVNALGEENLVVLRGDDVDAFTLGYAITTTEEFLEGNADVLEGFLRATARGWQDAIANPQEAAETVLEFNPDLDLESQLGQVAGMTAIMCDGISLNPDTGWGYANPEHYETTAEIVRLAGESGSDIQVEGSFTNALWEALDEDLTSLPCP